MKRETYYQILKDCHSDQMNEQNKNMTYMHKAHKLPEPKQMLIEAVESEDVLYILLFWINPIYRNQGYGTRELTKLCNRFEKVSMIVDGRAETMQHLCRSIGLRESEQGMIDSKTLFILNKDIPENQVKDKFFTKGL